MAAARSYCDDLQLPHCGSNRLPKVGRSRCKQACRCCLCYYRFTPDGNRHYYSEPVKKIELSDGRRCVDFEVVDRSGETFLRLYERLPEAERYYSVNDYGVYGSWLPAERRTV